MSTFRLSRRAFVAALSVAPLPAFALPAFGRARQALQQPRQETCHARVKRMTQELRAALDETAGQLRHDRWTMCFDRAPDQERCAVVFADEASCTTTWHLDLPGPFPPPA